MGKRKKPTAYFYTYGKFGKGIRETLDTDSNTIYERGRRKTKFIKDDFESGYCSVNTKSFWYMDGFIKTTDIVDVVYKPTMINHLFKDDNLYISYNKPIEKVKDRFGFTYYDGYDVCVCGNCIVDLIKSIDGNNPALKSKVTALKRAVNKKVRWYYEKYPEWGNAEIKDVRKINIFKKWIR